MTKARLHKAIISLGVVVIGLLFIDPQDVDCAPGRLVPLRPLRAVGRLRTSSGKAVNAAFLSRARGLEVLDNEGEADSEVRLLDVVPLQVTTSSSFISRDGGLYDNLFRLSPEGLLPTSTNPLAKKNLYDSVFQLSLSSKSQEAAHFLQGLESVLELTITALLIEVVDEIGQDTISIGSSALVARSSCAQDWHLSVDEDVLGKLGSAKAGQQACLIPCHNDELISLSLHMNLPVHISRNLFNAVSLDATLTRSAGEKGALEIEATSPPRTNAKRKSITTSEAVSPAWEIFDPDVFLSMGVIQKRAVLRASGVTGLDLPRPRQGKSALDSALYGVMDAAVREEVKRRLSQSPTVSSSSSSSSSSERHLLLQGMARALDEGDMATAERLRDEFALRTSLRADPTQEEGSYDRFLDQDDWYARNRKRSMGNNK